MNCPEGAKCAGSTCAFSNDPPSCEGPLDFLGVWNQTADDTWRLINCPPGHSLVNSLDGTSNGDFSHDAQQCSPCDSDEYVINPSTGACQKCPPGMVCSEGQVESFVTLNSTWVAENGIWWLRSCPIGYKVYNESAELQECQFCAAGYQCPQEPCLVCMDCPAGTYKASESADLCLECPENTYNDRWGATTISDCLSCPLGAITNGTGKGSVFDCFCDTDKYDISLPNSSSVACEICPQGAICEDLSCGLSYPDQTCPARVTASSRRLVKAGRKIPGVWTRGEDRRFILRDCPAGYRLINASDGSAYGIFSHQNQQCFQCRICEVEGAFCRAAEYLLDQMKFPCRMCPLGAVCNGETIRTVNDLDLYGAKWVAGTDGQFWLTKCPTGYRMENDTGYENQQCVKCEEDFFIARSDDPSFQCYRCPTSATCPNGGPPEFGTTSVQTSLSFEGFSTYDAGTQRAVVEAIAEALGISADLVVLEGVVNADGESAMGGMRRFHDNRRSLEQSSSAITVSFKVPSDVNSADQVASTLSDANFVEAVTAGVENKAGVELAASGGITTVEVQPPNGGAQFVMKNGVPQLINCDPGHLLLNSSINSQQCLLCKPTTYSLNPFDGCREGVCATRGCYPCSVGADCPGGSQFIPKVDGSVWELEDVKEQESQLYRIQSAPPGYVLIRDFANARDDQAVGCGYAEYALEPALYGGDVMYKETLATEVSDDRLCLECPRGSLCSAELTVMPRKNWWRGSNMDCPKSACPRGNCNPGSCMDLGSPRQDEDADDFVRPRAMLYRCPAAVCRQTTTPLAYGPIAARRDGHDNGFQGNICREGHGGVLCGICIEGWAPAMGRCGPCGGEGATPYVIITLLVIFAMTFWYIFAWRPLLIDYETALIEAFKTRVLGIDTVPNGTEGRFARWIRIFKSNFSTDSFKITIGFYQVGGSFITTFAVDWPPKLLNLLAVTSSLFQFDFMAFPGLTCKTSGVKFTYKLIITTLFPAVGVCMLLLPTIIASISKSHKFDQTLQRFWHALFFFLFALYPASSFATLRAFSCRDLGTDGNWLRADLSFPCPGPKSDPLTYFWAVMFTILIPIGVPVFILWMLISHRIPQMARTKKVNSVLNAFLMKWAKQGTKVAAFVEAFGAQLRKSELKWRIKEAYHRTRIPNTSLVGQEGLGQLLYVMGLDLDDDDLLRIINVHGKAGTIDRRGVRNYLRELHMRFKTKQSIMSGNEDPSDLTNEQLKALCAEPWERKAKYKVGSTGASRMREVISGEAFAPAQFDAETFETTYLDPYKGYTRSDLIAVLMRMARRYEASGDLSIEKVQWDGSSAEERVAIDRLGFLFLTYNPKCWYYELVEMARKLTIAAILVFIYDGSPSQVAVGFVITMVIIVICAALRPFADPVLGALYMYAMGVQMVTLFYGLLIITGQFEELVGEANGGWINGFSVRDFLLALNCTIFCLPIFKFAILKMSMPRSFQDFVESIKSRVPFIESTARKDDAAAKRMAMKAKLANHVIKVEQQRAAEESGEPEGAVMEDGVIEADIVVSKSQGPSRAQSTVGDNHSQAEYSDEEAASDDDERPKEVEFEGLKRMTQHAELIESAMNELIESQRVKGYGDDFENSVQDFEILLDKMRSDANELRRDLRSEAAQDRVGRIARATVGHLEDLLDSIKAEALEARRAVGGIPWGSQGLASDDAYSERPPASEIYSEAPPHHRLPDDSSVQRLAASDTYSEY